MKFRSALLALSVLGGARGRRLAQPVTGPYVSLNAGINYIMDQDFEERRWRHHRSGQAEDINVGGIVSAAVGYGLGKVSASNSRATSWERRSAATRPATTSRNTTAS